MLRSLERSLRGRICDDTVLDDAAAGDDSAVLFAGADA